MTLTRALFLIAGALSAIAGVLAVFPVVKPENFIEPPVPDITAATTEFESLANWFDLSTLPAPEVVEAAPAPLTPAPDPAQALKSYRFIGLSISEWRAVGVFSLASDTLVLTPGASLEGFDLLSISTQGAEFQNNEGVSVVLALEAAPSQ